MVIGSLIVIVVSKSVVGASATAVSSDLVISTVNSCAVASDTAIPSLVRMAIWPGVSTKTLGESETVVVSDLFIVKSSVARLGVSVTVVGSDTKILASSLTVGTSLTVVSSDLLIVSASAPKIG